MFLLGQNVRLRRCPAPRRRRHASWSCEALESRLMLDSAFGLLVADVLLAVPPPADRLPSPPGHETHSPREHGPVWSSGDRDSVSASLAADHAQHNERAFGLALGLGNGRADHRAAGRAHLLADVSAQHADLKLVVQAAYEIAGYLSRVPLPALLPAGQIIIAAGSHVSVLTISAATSFRITIEFGTAEQSESRPTQPGGRDDTAETPPKDPDNSFDVGGGLVRTGPDRPSSGRTGAGPRDDSRAPRTGEDTPPRIAVFVLPSSERFVQSGADDDAEDAAPVLLDGGTPQAQAGIDPIDAAFLDSAFAELATTSGAGLDDLRADTDLQLALIRRAAAARDPSADFVTPLDFSADAGESGESASPVAPLPAADGDPVPVEAATTLNPAEAGAASVADEPANHAAQRAWWIAAASVALAGLAGLARAGRRFWRRRFPIRIKFRADV